MNFRKIFGAFVPGLEQTQCPHERALNFMRYDLEEANRLREEAEARFANVQRIATLTIQGLKEDLAIARGEAWAREQDIGTIPKTCPLEMADIGDAFPMAHNDNKR
jgi:hypothetical protein